MTNDNILTARRRIWSRKKYLRIRNAAVSSVFRGYNTVQRTRFHKDPCEYRRIIELNNYEHMNDFQKNSRQIVMIRIVNVGFLHLKIKMQIMRTSPIWKKAKKQK